MRKFRKIVRELDESGFKPMPKSSLKHEDNYNQLVDNLNSMLNLPYTKEARTAMLKQPGYRPEFGMAITDYAWTEEVKEAFYNHPYHKAMVEGIKGDPYEAWAYFTAQFEPVDISVFDKEKVPYEEVEQ